MSTKRYRLEKSLPDSKSGDEYIWVDRGINFEGAYYKGGDVNESYWLKESVENNPEWFSLIEDEKKEFYWTDALVKEMIYEKVPVPDSYFGNIQKMLDDFKTRNASHQSIKEEQPKSDIREWIEHLEKCKSPEQPKRDWEIVELTDNPGRGGNFITRDAGYIKAFLSGYKGTFQIHSVKRLSDNEVFSVGDEVNFGGLGEEIWEIDRFEITSQDRVLCYGSHARRNSRGLLGTLKKRHLQPQPTKEKTEITFLSEFAGNKSFQYALHSTKKITPDKFEQLGKACEEALNDDCKSHDGKGRGKNFGTQFEQLAYWGTHSGWRYCQGCNEPILKLSHFENMVDYIEKETPATYTQQQVDEIEEAAFNEARLRHPGFPKVTGLKYITFMDYKKIKK